MKFNKGKCKDLLLERNSFMHKYMLAANWLESSFAEKDLGVLLDTKLNMSPMASSPALECCQKAEGSDDLPLLSTGETTVVVEVNVLASARIAMSY
ncbi:hypothetical protein QYF61_007894 [Mycteria americana]|uniref:Uncharacterized protein n=1 Tax=Mycteria americana TaxID=33587 RepID=A0AAN7MP23_MYCAM|nr:hypothetical protein QYF61_007894 [Mycteria americana]